MTNQIQRSSWESIQLGQLASFRNGINFDSGSFGLGLRIINVADFGERTIPDYDSLPEVSESALSSQESLLADRDIVAVRSNGNRMLIGRTMFIRQPPRVTHSAFTIRIRIEEAGRERLMPEFLAHVLRGPMMRSALSNEGHGTNISNLNQKILKSLDIFLPPIVIQRKIVAILSAYDDLIENNNRRIRLLEDISQRIYREWFVDLRYPGHQNIPLVVNSEHGCQVPEGWISGPLRKVVGYHIGGGWGADEVSGSHELFARVIRGTDIPRIRRGDVASCPARFHTAANLRSRLLHDGDIVFEVSGGSKGQPVGRSALISVALLNELGMDTICAGFCKLVRSDRDVLLPELLNCRFLDAYQTGEISPYQVQSTGITNLRFSQLLESFPVLVPPMAIQSRFVDCISPMISAVTSLGIQIRNLRAARDLLLPRLVSGEIDVTDFDIAMPEEAA